MKINYNNAIFKRPLKTINCLKGTHKIKPLVVHTMLATVKKSSELLLNISECSINCYKSSDGITSEKAEAKAFITKETI